MSRPLYIGISGKARVGKNTTAQAIHELAPRESTIMGFADALKAHCRVAWGMRTKDPALLQYVGVAVRQADEETWIRVLQDTAEESGYPIILIPDVRFRNEAQFVKDCGGLLVRVIRPGFVATDRPADHISEVDLDDYQGWDGVLEAVGMGELEAKARVWWKSTGVPYRWPLQLATMPPLPAEEAA